MCMCVCVCVFVNMYIFIPIYIYVFYIHYICIFIYLYVEFVRAALKSYPPSTHSPKSSHSENDVRINHYRGNFWKLQLIATDCNSPRLLCAPPSPPLPP